jgi:hypothetical protein
MCFYFIFPLALESNVATTMLSTSKFGYGARFDVIVSVFILKLLSARSNVTSKSLLLKLVFDVSVHLSKLVWLVADDAELGIFNLLPLSNASFAD